MDDPPPAPAPQRTIVLWDWPVRLVHWSFVALVPALWWTAHHDALDWHKRCGLVMLGLVVFRLLWGVAGSAPARFAAFVRGPGAVRAYLRDLRAGLPAPPGHNPLGGWSVIALLAGLTAQIGFGLITTDTDGLESGPLNHLVSYDTADFARELHEGGFNLLLALIALHLAAIVWYRVAKRENLVGPMLTGRRAVAADVPAPELAPAWRAAGCAGAAFALMWWITAGAPPL